MTSLLLKLFVKDHNDVSSPTVRAAVGRLAGLTGIVCNVLLSLFKLIIGLLADSVSIIADAANNTSDAASSIVTLLAFRMSQKPADKDHPYGHARYEYVAGLLVSVLILVIGGELAMSSAEKIFHPAPTQLSLVSFAVLAGSILMKLWMTLFYRRLGKHIGSAPLRATAADCQNDVLATSAVLVACLTEYMWGWRIDAYIGLAVAVFILWSGCRLVRETISPLLGMPADKEQVAALEALVLSHEKVLGIHDLLIHDYGPGRCFASIHAELSATEDPLCCHAIIDSIEHAALDALGIRLVIHYDPVDTSDSRRESLQALTASVVTAIDARLSLHDFHVVSADGVTRLHFDLTLPYALQGEHDAIKTAIEEQLALRGEAFETVIDFDETDDI